MSRYEQNPASAKTAIIDAHTATGDQELFVPDSRTQLLFVWMLAYTGTWLEGLDITPSDMSISHDSNTLLSMPIVAVQKRVICVSRPLMAYPPLEAGGNSLLITLRNALGTDGFYIGGVGIQAA